MTIEVDADYVHISKEDWGWLVIWSVDKDLASEKYVMIQAKDEYSQEDVRLGMNDIYIECCGQGWSWYGHIQSFILAEKRIDVRLDRKAAEHMRNDGRFLVAFSITEEERKRLRDTVRQVFNGRSYYSEA